MDDLFAFSPSFSGALDWAGQKFFSEVRSFFEQLFGDAFRQLRTLIFVAAPVLLVEWRQWIHDEDAGRPSRFRLVVRDHLSFLLNGRGRSGGAVLGVGGSGKTTLVEYLNHDHVSSRVGILPESRWSIAAAEGLQKTIDKVYKGQITLGGGVRRYVVTGLGEEYRVAHGRHLNDVAGQAWADGGWECEVRSLFAKYEHVTIVMVQCWGYSAAAMRDPEFPKTASEMADFVAKFRRKICIEERLATKAAVEALIAMDTTFAHRKVKLTYIQLVNMAGFWWSQKETVKNHYQSGEFAEFRRQLSDQFGDRLTYRGFEPASLLFGDIAADEKRAPFRSSDGGVPRIFVRELEAMKAREELQLSTRSVVELVRGSLFERARRSFPRNSRLDLRDRKRDRRRSNVTNDLPGLLRAIRDGLRNIDGLTGQPASLFLLVSLPIIGALMIAILGAGVGYRAELPEASWIFRILAAATLLVLLRAAYLMGRAFGGTSELKALSSATPQNNGPVAEKIAEAVNKAVTERKKIIAETLKKGLTTAVFPILVCVIWPLFNFGPIFSAISSTSLERDAYCWFLAGAGFCALLAAALSGLRQGARSLRDVYSEVQSGIYKTHGPIQISGSAAEQKALKAVFSDIDYYNRRLRRPR